MKLSVVIPAHNEENYIGTCLRSILREGARSGHDVEVVVVNNASTDRMAEVSSHFQGVRVVDEPRKGLSMARHCGYLETSGELVANVDADCIMPSGYIQYFVRQFERDGRLACLTGPFYYYDLPQFARIIVHVYYLFQFFPNVIGQRILKMGAVAQGGNFVARRSALDRVGGYNTDIIFYGVDTDIATRLSRVGLVRFTFGLRMRTSGRRLREQGLLISGYYYVLNFFFMTFYRRPLTRTHTDIRAV
jgi:glycosyltransferase involved in cell wall biosynthesis